MTFSMDERLLAFINGMIDTSDTILLGNQDQESKPNIFTMKAALELIGTLQMKVPSL